MHNMYCFHVFASVRRIIFNNSVYNNKYYWYTSYFLIRIVHKFNFYNNYPLFCNHYNIIIMFERCVEREFKMDP